MRSTKYLKVGLYSSFHGDRSGRSVGNAYGFGPLKHWLPFPLGSWLAVLLHFQICVGDPNATGVEVTHLRGAIYHTSIKLHY
jgi:hypothetical protein